MKCSGFTSAAAPSTILAKRFIFMGKKFVFGPLLSAEFESARRALLPYANFGRIPYNLSFTLTTFAPPLLCLKTASNKHLRRPCMPG